MRIDAINAFGILVVLIISGVLMFSAATCWVTDYHNIQLAAESLKWPTTTAKIVSSSVDVKQEYSKNGPHETFKNLVRYEYKVHGKRYSSDRICFAGVADHYSRDGLVTRHISELYAVGTKHPLHYNPAHPDEATLNAGVDADRSDFQSIKMFCFSVITLLLCAVSRNSRSYSMARGQHAAVTVCFLLSVTILLVVAWLMQSIIVRQLVPQTAIVQFLR